MQIKLIILFILICSKAITVFGIKDNFNISHPGIVIEKENNSFPNNNIYLSEWKLGIGLHSEQDTNAFIYFRFYEWHLFDAILAGDHTRGKDMWIWNISKDRQEANLNSESLSVNIKVVGDGAEIKLSITNNSDHDWPEIAAIVPCLSPEYERHNIPVNTNFLDEEHKKTYYINSEGFGLLKMREIHFNAALKQQVINRSQDSAGYFPLFSPKWPTSHDDAVEGLMLREAADGKWITGIAWENYLSAQGHNPRKCMHLSLRVGPLKVGESKTIRGKIYLFKGSKEDCIRHYNRDFN